MHLRPNWVVVRVSQLCNHPTWLPTPSGGKSTINWCHRIEDTSLSALQCFWLRQRGISTRKLKIYTMDGSKYCAKNECYTMIVAAGNHQHTSSGANRPSDVAWTVNFNAEFNLIVVNSIIECFSKDLIPEYWQGLESDTVYTVPPFFVESLKGHSNRSLPCLPLHVHAEEIIPTFLTSNINIRFCLPNALTLKWLRSYKMYKVVLIVRINISMGLRGIIIFHLLRDAFPYRLARGIPFKEGVLYLLWSKVRTTPPHPRWTIYALQISLNVSFPPHPLDYDGQ